tara:strand:+ start:580 stop:786 length:207 start_codon:yes stop_codon:yes gene_type:complete
MKLVLKITFILLALVTFSEESHSLTNFQIKKICRKEIRELTCIKNLLEKKSDLEKGKYIEIKVIPYKR